VADPFTTEAGFRASFFVPALLFFCSSALLVQHQRIKVPGLSRSRG
jgi:hypothetical protein